MPVSGAPLPGETAAAGPVEQAKPEAFLAFERYVNASSSRVDALADLIDKEGVDQGSDTSFWHSSPISKADADHFLADWLGGGYWNSTSKNKGEELYRRLRKGVRKAARKARSDKGPYKKLRMELWVDAGAGKVGHDVVEEDGEVRIKIVAPPV